MPTAGFELPTIIRTVHLSTSRATSLGEHCVTVHTCMLCMALAVSCQLARSDFERAVWLGFKLAVQPAALAVGLWPSADRPDLTSVEPAGLGPSELQSEGAARTDNLTICGD